MPGCIQCGAETQLHDGGVPICLDCSAARQQLQRADLRPKPPQSERTLGSVNAHLSTARAEYRVALSMQIECSRAMDHPKTGNPDGSQALRNANEQLAVAAARYEDALREFIAFTDPHRRAG